MLPFSSLFTQVPLMILAAAYMLYFGAYAIGKSKENISENQPEPREESAYLSSASPDLNAYHFNTENEVGQDLDITDTNTCTFNLPDESVSIYRPVRFLNSHLNYYTLFSRPPPVQG